MGKNAFLEFENYKFDQYKNGQSCLVNIYLRNKTFTK